MLKRWTACLVMCLMMFSGAQAEEAYTEEAFIETPENIIVSAMEVFSWFTISPLDVDVELACGIEGRYRVADEALCRQDVLMSLLGEYFSPEIIEGMLAYEVYTVVDGFMYGDGVGRSIDPNISEVEYEETFSDEARVVYTVTVHYLGEGENGIVPDVFEFIREKQEDRWVFTQFPFFW